ncbi:MAG TPA: ABC transporter substrate-binding protein [Desulfobacteraceae bacterium]|nr:ABC transporter substrate-binding protein [Desulfobacteraceae bacterium]
MEIPADREPSKKALKNPDARQVLKFAVHVSSAENLDPHFAAGSQDRALADMVFNGLFRYKPGRAPRIEPDLAAGMPRFEIIDTKQVWTVALRPGVMFHSAPGIPAHELTAADVVFSLEKSADKNHSAYSGDYSGMRFRQKGRYTLDIILDHPVSGAIFFPKFTDYAGGFIVSRRAVQAMGYDGFHQHPVGTGPFVFQQHLPGKKIILRAHDAYFRGPPLLKGVELFFAPGIRERENGLKSGKFHVIMGTGEKGWIEKIQQTPDIRLDFHGVGEVVTIHLNTAMKPLDDIRVRRAIAWALSRKTFLDTSHPRLVQAVYSPVPAPLMPGGVTKKEAQAATDLTYTRNLEKALALLREAGYPDGFNLDLVSSEKRLYLSCYRSMRDQLVRIGIQCRIKVKNHAAMHREIRQVPKPIVLYVAWRPNADRYLSRFFHSNAVVVSGPTPDTNFSHYTKVDRLIEDARLALSPERQVDLWQHAQIRILHDMAAYPIMVTRQCYARKARVDYGHELVATMALYPQFTEKTRIEAKGNR